MSQNEAYDNKSTHSFQSYVNEMRVYILYLCNEYHMHILKKMPAADN